MHKKRPKSMKTPEIKTCEKISGNGPVRMNFQESIQHTAQHAFLLGGHSLCLEWLSLWCCD